MSFTIDLLPLLMEFVLARIYNLGPVITGCTKGFDHLCPMLEVSWGESVANKLLVDTESNAVLPSAFILYPPLFGFTLLFPAA
jgi:hypothetical protein